MFGSPRTITWPAGYQEQAPDRKSQFGGDLPRWQVLTRCSSVQPCMHAQQLWASALPAIESDSKRLMTRVISFIRRRIAS
jgi:hypothetical protein